MGCQIHGLVLPEHEILLPFFEVELDRPAHRIYFLGSQKTQFRVGGEDYLPPVTGIPLAEEHPHQGALVFGHDGEISAPVPAALHRPPPVRFYDVGRIHGFAIDDEDFLVVLRHSEDVPIVIKPKYCLYQLVAHEPAVYKQVLVLNVATYRVTHHGREDVDLVGEVFRYPDVRGVALQVHALVPCLALFGGEPLVRVSAQFSMHRVVERNECAAAVKAQ